jgi:hypothetical protein
MKKYGCKFWMDKVNTVSQIKLEEWLQQSLRQATLRRVWSSPAAIQCWKHFKVVMEAIYYIPNSAEPCLFINKLTKKSSVVIYVVAGGIFST